MHHLKKRPFIAVLLLVLSSSTFLSAEIFSQASRLGSLDDADGTTCGTQYWFSKDPVYQNALNSRACFQYGVCDDPAARDAMIPDSTTPITYLRMMIHIIAEDDGSNPVSTPLVSNAMVTTLNEDILPSRIQFIVEFNQINSSQWRKLGEDEIIDMKTSSAIKPDSMLNVWVVDPEFSYSFGTFPFTSNALLSTGGVVMGDFHWYGGSGTFAHEVGHNLGLFHTFNGIDEVSLCGPCYEFLDATDAERDLLGDRCSDTEPAPTASLCGVEPGNDPCSNLPWGDVSEQASSFMSYSSSCWNQFTKHQQGRMHCWIDNLLSSWNAGIIITADANLGDIPFDVQFSGFSDKPIVTGWLWEFGDGNNSNDQNPLHTYNTPGLFTVDAEITTPDSFYTAKAIDIVAVPSDTIYAEEILAGLGSTVAFNIYFKNYIPVTRIKVPFTWSGNLNLKYAGISRTGLRTEFMTGQFVHKDFNNNRGSYNLLAPFGTSLQPGDGPIFTLFFTVSGNADDTAFVNIESYSVHTPILVSTFGDYSPADLTSGFIVSSCCTARGDVLFTFGEPVNISDLTYFVSYLFKNGPPPYCELSSDIDGNGLYNISDLTFFVSYLFKSGPAPPPCF